MISDLLLFVFGAITVLIIAMVVQK